MKNKQAKWEEDFDENIFIPHECNCASEIELLADCDCQQPTIYKEIKAFIFRVEKTSYAEGYREALKNVEKLLPYGVCFTDKFYALKKKVEEK